MPPKSQKNRTPAPLLPELVFADSTSKTAYRRRKEALEKGELRQIAPKIFTRNFSDPPEDILRRNWKEVLGYLYPEAVVSHRTAFDLKPDEEGGVYLTYSYTKTRELPGLTVHLLKGPEKQEDDVALPGGLYLSSDARKALENLEPSHRRPGKTLPRAGLEQWLETLLHVRGEKGLNDLRDRAREISDEGWPVEMKKLDQIVGALLRTRPASELVSDSARRRARGIPYDPARIELFDTLFTALTTDVMPSFAAPALNAKQTQAFAFFESYFSNFIEGTEFEVDEAKDIVFSGKVSSSRPKDSHDILGVYQLASQAKMMKKVPEKSELIDHIKDLHHRMLSNRPETRPGQFKEKRNKAGETHFVDPELVTGTLLKGFEYYQPLAEGFPRAAFMMFLISEVHPFDDGNGRLARLMMNAELSHASTFRLLVPIVYRDDYLLALRKLSRQKKPGVYVRMVEKLYRFSSLLAFKDVNDLERILTSCNAFKEPDGNVLRMP